MIYFIVIIFALKSTKNKEMIGMRTFMMKRNLLLLILGFCSLNTFIACSHDDEEPDWDGFLETHEVILDSHANDTIIKFKNDLLSGITGVSEVVGEKTIKYEFDYNLGILQGEWFGIVLQDDKINIRTLRNSSGTERMLKIYMFYGGQGDYLHILQKSMY